MRMVLLSKTLVILKYIYIGFAPFGVLSFSPFSNLCEICDAVSPDIKKLTQSTFLQMYLPCRTKVHHGKLLNLFHGELIDLVSPVTIFLFQTTFLRLYVLMSRTRFRVN